jgi:hypothetical protein
LISMNGKVMKKLLIAFLLLAAPVFGQTASIEVVPVDQEPSHHLVFENEYVRVFSVEVAPHSETKYHQHDRDYVGVILGDADVESVRLGEATVSLKLKDGEARFTKGGFAHKAVNKSDKPFKNVTVEWKKGRPGEVETCAAPKECVRTSRTGGHVISVTTTLFTSRSLRAFRHTLSARGSLASSYYSPGSDDNILMVALTPFSASLDGANKSFAAGESWFGKVQEVEVTAGDQDAAWVVMRMTLPLKKTDAAKARP